MANKVEFGISQLHVCTYEDDGEGNITLGTPYHQKGAKSFSPEQDSENNVDYADNIDYWSEYTEGPISGDLEVEIFDDDFKIKYLGYRRLTNGGLAAVKNAKKPKVCVFFQVEGDAESRRVAFYNCALGPIGRSYETIGENKEPVTETVPVTCNGDNESGARMAVFKPTDAGYDTLFSNPAAPELESES